MKFIATADWQVAPNNLDRCEIMRDHLLMECDKHKVAGVVHLGDAKEAFNPVDLRVSNFLADTVDTVCSVADRFFFMLRGNHDNANVNDTSQSILPLLAAAGATTASAPMDTLVGIWGIPVRAVPFLRSNEETIAALAKPFELRGGPRLLFFHNEVAGSKWNTLAESKGQVTLEHLHSENYALCLGGHIHYQQQLSENVWYVGSPFCMDWSEANQEKGFLLVEISGKTRVKVTRIPSKLPGWYDPKMPGFPKRKFWHGCNIRIQAQTGKDVTSAVQAAGARAVKQYEGCVPHVVPVYEDAAEEVQGVKGSNDTSLLRSYLKQRYPGEKISGMLAYLSSQLPGTFTFGIKGAKLKSVVAQNVLCFRTCSLELDRPGITLITGKNKDWPGRANGAGKTSALSLPAIAWFGESLKGQRTDAWRSNSADGPSLVMSTAELPDGKELVVTRGRSPGKFDLSLDGKDETMGDVHATQRRIEELTGLSLDVFRNSLYVGQHEVAVLLHGTDKERKELFSRMLGLERFLKAQKLIRSDIVNTTKMIDLCAQEMELSKRALHEISYIPTSIELLEPMPVENVIKLKRSLKVIDAHIAEAQGSLEQLQERRRLIGNALVEANTKLGVYRKQLAAMGASKKCPVCGSVLKAGDSSAFHKAEMQKAIGEAEVVVKQAEDEVAALVAKVDEARNGLREYEESQHDLEDRLRQAELNASHNEELKKANRSRIEARKKTLRRIMVLKRSVARHKAACLSYVDTKDFLERCFQAVSREGLPTYMCAKVCPQLNAAASRHSEVFSEGEIQIQFHVEGGDLDVKITNRHGGDGIGDQSMGESGVASLIAIFAFKEVLVPVPLLILDEPGEGLDAVNAANFAKGIHAVADRFGSVFITSHNPNIIANLDPDHHLEVVKHKGVATIERIR